MKSKFFLIVTLVFLFISASISAENKTAFIDLDLIVNKSDVGIKLIKKISIFETNLKEKFLSKEAILKKKKKKLFDQKNIISKSEFQKKLSELKVDVKKFNQESDKERKKLIITRNNYNLKLLKAINPILATYSEEKDISILLQKKNIILGSSQLDITNDILKIVNKEITESNIK
jgi:outer membrane protein|tara:strand:- start:592 stop:1116 length:525 start_codon:yes stop_codon:yes gene_type:complete